MTNGLNHKLEEIQFQIALFPINYSFSDTKEQYLKLKSNLKHLFDGNNQILPYPVNAPDDKPRIILRSNDSKLECQISFSKISIFRIRTIDEKTFSPTYNELWNIVDKIWEKVLGRKKITRVGLIKDMLIKKIDPLKTISDEILCAHSLKVEDLELTDYQLVLTYKRQIEKFKCNHLVHLISGSEIENIDNKLILLKSDLNTSQEVNLNSDKASTKVIIKSLFDKSDTEDLYKLFLDNK